jgi:GNAT superfamily N-acetyltransferase
MSNEAVRATSVSLQSVRADESEALVRLRIEAMRESLERIGRFDATRARERFLSSFVPEHTSHILLAGERVGFLAVKPTAEGLSLEHLYVRPEHQGRGIGAAVLGILFAEADSKSLPLHVGALRDSDANRFYLRQGFVRAGESEWDIYYVRPAKTQPAL